MAKKRILSATEVDLFTENGFDNNIHHKNEVMWKMHRIPGLIPGLQLLGNAIATMDVDVLTGLNYVDANFNAFAPIGSEVDFDSKRKGDIHRLSARANGLETLGDKTEFSTVLRLAPRDAPGFYEGSSITKLLVNESNLQKFGQATGLPDNVVPGFYAAMVSTASITDRVMNPSTPSWMRLNRDLQVEDPTKAKFPVYKRVMIYFPSGLRGFNPREGIQLRSAVQRMGPLYTVDTITYDGAGEVICGVRSHLKQNGMRVIVRGVEELLKGLDKSGNPGVLASTIERMKGYQQDTANGGESTN